MKKLDAVRAALPISLVALIAVAYIAKIPIGNLSAFGLDNLLLLCPLGALAAMIASKTIIPAAVLSLVCFVLLVVVVGRAFCSWVCPVPLVGKIRHVFSGKGETRIDKRSGRRASALAQGKCAASSCSSCASRRGIALDSRHLVLGGALGATLLFGFPVFCLVCPIGLTFASVFLVVNLFAHGDVTWAVVVVPALLLVEAVFFRKWCHRLCPLSALMSLTARANRTFTPVINDEACLETAKGASCGRCGDACAEGIDLRHPELSEAALNECTRCRACAEGCPAGAITFPVLSSTPVEEVNDLVPDVEH